MFKTVEEKNETLAKIGARKDTSYPPPYYPFTNELGIPNLVSEWVWKDSTGAEKSRIENTGIVPIEFDARAFMAAIDYSDGVWRVHKPQNKAKAVKAVYTSGPVTTMIFHNGHKVQVRVSKHDLYIAEKGLAMVVCKACLDKKTYEELCKYEALQTVVAVAKAMVGLDTYREIREEKWKVFE